MSESRIMREIMLAVSAAGSRIFRNNVGLFFTKDGRPVRCGLTKGSSDLIGWTPVTVTPDMVGSKIAVFTAIETKSKSGRASKEQTQFLKVVQESGGIGVKASSIDQAMSAIKSRSN